MKDQLKVFLWAMLLGIIGVLYMKWMAANQPVIEPTTASQGVSISANDVDVPVSGEVGNTTASMQGLDSYQQSSDYITVNTDVLSLQISLKGGDIINEKLLNYPISI